MEHFCEPYLTWGWLVELPHEVVGPFAKLFDSCLTIE
jgi:hypothetical protein